MSNSKISRQTILKGGSTILSLPFLESTQIVNATDKEPAKRFVGINIPMGFYPPNFFPKDSGYNYKMSPYLMPAEKLRKDFTVISGTSLPGVNGGHSSDKCFLTGAPGASSRSFKNSISLDQVMAKHLGHQTRYASITMGYHGLSWSRNGVCIPPEKRPDNMFMKLFTTPDAIAQAKALQGLENGRSVMDHVLQEAKNIKSKISHKDQQKLEQYFTAVRETELNLQKAKMWSKKPRPKINTNNPGYTSENDLIGNMQRSLQVIKLILETDQSRIVTYGANFGYQIPTIQGVSEGYHVLTHHGKNPNKIAQLELIDREVLKTFFSWLRDMKETSDQHGSLLDHTHILLGSNLGDANLHNNKNLPIILAGGNFKHGQHLAFDKMSNEPLSNAYLSLLHAMGINEKKFSSSKGLLKGLDFKV